MLAQGDVLAAGEGTGGGSLVVILLIGLALYLIPTIVAATRKVPNVGSVVVINIFLGWSIIGWVAALAMASRSRPQPHPAR